MPDTPLAVIVLAAGEGTRMRSARPKVLHEFAGRSLLGHVLAAAAPLNAAHTVVVVGHRRDEVSEHLAEIAPDAVAVVQHEQHGTGHAVRIGLDAIPPDAAGTVLVLPGDAPLLTPDTLRALVAANTGAVATVLSSDVDDATGYGRVIRAADGSVQRIVEQTDASAEERLVREIGTSVYAFDHALLREAVGRLSTDNAQGEEYLTDVIGIFVADGHLVPALLAPAAETAGVNDRVQLAGAHKTYNTRLLEAHMRAGVTIVDPDSTWIDATVTLDADVTVLPSTDLHGATDVAEGATIGPQTSLTDTTVGPRARITRAVAVQAQIGADVTIGPYAYLRPGTVLHDGVHIGTYVELKAAEVGERTKIPHLTYVGDATIGHHTNIGAASVFVNYDGANKHHTVIGDHARTGADNMFVAPVQVGDGAYTAAGSVIVVDVPAGAMAIARGRQRNIEGWVARRRAGTPSAEAAERAVTKSDTDQTDPNGTWHAG
jgi:bifunctional UDP-N-acetylglucosamine pyrophosphorylase / glucosamine-1-phosphate N-acetyltransferase